jgi:hypothetical protein
MAGVSTGDQTQPSDVSQAEKVAKILSDADRRDAQATARDADSDKREEAADLIAFLAVGAEYRGQGERRAASLDRAHSKHDRELSARDRAELLRELRSETDG